MQPLTAQDRLKVLAPFYAKSDDAFDALLKARQEYDEVCRLRFRAKSEAVQSKLAELEETCYAVVLAKSDAYFESINALESARRDFQLMTTGGK